MNRSGSPGVGWGLGGVPGVLGGLVVTVMIVVLGAGGVASGGQQGGSSRGSGWGSDLGDLQSMRLSEVGETLTDWRRVLLIVGSILVIVLLWGGDAIRPGSLTRSGVRNVKPLPTPVWLMAAFIVLLTPSLTLAPVSRMEFLTGPDPEGLRAIAVGQGVAYLAGVVVALGLAFMAAKAAPQAGCKLDWVDVPVGLGLLLLAAPIVLLSGDLAMLVHQSLTEEAPATAVAHPMLARMVENRGDLWTWVLIAVAVVGAPIVEEVVYRVFVQSAFLRLTGHAWISVILTAAIFGTMHALGPAGTALPWYAAVMVGFLGLCCGGAFERTKRLGVPIAMHAAFNAGNVALAMWGTSGASAG